MNETHEDMRLDMIAVETYDARDIPRSGCADHENYIELNDY